MAATRKLATHKRRVCACTEETVGAGSLHVHLCQTAPLSVPMPLRKYSDMPCAALSNRH